MSKFIPDYVFDSIYDITPGILQSHGIRAALIDLDGTMVSHKTALPTEEVAAFIRRLEDNGIHVVVFSNNNANRVGTFCEPLGVDFISRAHKPFARAYAQAVEKLGLPIDQIAVIGDQIYTDVFGGIDGDGPQGIVGIHTGFHGHAGIEGQVVQRGNRCIGNNGNMAASFCQDAWSGPAFI